MPKIVRIINRLNLGGPTYNAAYLTKYLSPDFETLLVAGNRDKGEESSEFILEKLNITPVIVPEMHREINFRGDKIAYDKIRNIIADYKPDIVHTHASKAGTIGRLAANSLKVPVIVHTFHGHVFHSYFNSIATHLFLRVERYLAKRSTRIIAISDLQKKDLAEKYKICKEEKIEVIPLGFDLIRFRENMDMKRKNFRDRFRIAENEIAIGIIGRLVPVKNHIHFLKAIQLLLQKGITNIRIFIIGDGTERKNIEKFLCENNISYNDSEQNLNPVFVTFTSWMKDVDIAMAGLDIIALSSLNEGTPVSLIEAQAAGKPIVSTAVGGIDNVVLQDQTALLSDSGDVEAFSNNLEKLILQPELRQGFSIKGWEFVKDKFHYSRLIRDTENLYIKLLNSVEINS